jgi:hypothetical protein
LSVDAKLAAFNLVNQIFQGHAKVMAGGASFSEFELQL